MGAFDGTHNEVKIKPQASANDEPATGRAGLDRDVDDILSLPEKESDRGAVSEIPRQYRAVTSAR